MRPTLWRAHSRSHWGVIADHQTAMYESDAKYRLRIAWWTARGQSRTLISTAIIELSDRFPTTSARLLPWLGTLTASDATSAAASQPRTGQRSSSSAGLCMGLKKASEFEAPAVVERCRSKRESPRDYAYHSRSSLEPPRDDIAGINNIHRLEGDNSCNYAKRQRKSKRGAPNDAWESLESHVVRISVGQITKGVGVAEREQRFGYPRSNVVRFKVFDLLVQRPQRRKDFVCFQV